MSNSPACAALTLLAIAGCGRIGFDPETAAPAVRSQLRLDRVAPDETLVDFVLPIVLDATRADLGRLTPETLRVYAVDGSELATEIESIGPPLVAWVRVPAIQGTTTTLTVEYGGAPATPLVVWGAEYAGVWHLDGDANDSSPYLRDGVETATGDTAGVVGRARAYPLGLDPCIVVSAFVDLPFDQATLSGWIRINAPTGEFSTVLTRQLDDTVSDDVYLGTDVETRVVGALDTIGGGSPSRSSPPITVGPWHHLAFSYDGAASALYVDGVRIESGPATGQPRVSSRPLFIGCGRNFDVGPIDQPDGDYVDGALDEIRFETTGRSQAWITYEYLAHQDLVISYGPVER